MYKKKKARDFLVNVFAKQKTVFNFAFPFCQDGQVKR